MAVNLRSKMGSDKTLLICDVSQDAIARFQKQMEGKRPIKVVRNGFDAVKQAVCQMAPNIPHSSIREIMAVSSPGPSSHIIYALL